MKQDILIYLLLPFPVLFLVTGIASLLQLLDIIDISAQLSGPQSGSPEFQFLFMMVIVYYGVIACIAKNSSKISQAKIVLLSVTKDKTGRSNGYGGDTQHKLKQLRQKAQFKEWEENKRKQSQKDASQKQQHQHKTKKTGHKLPHHHHHHSDSGQDSENEMQGITCHQMATTKKMF